MKCRHCGKEIPNDSNFCEFCGKKVKKKMPVWAVLLIVLGCVVVLGLGMVTGLLISGNSDSKEKPAPDPVVDTLVEAPVTSGVTYQDGSIMVDGKKCYDMKYVEGGTFTMGCTSEQGSDCDSDEKPAHRVTVSSFYMGETEVTQALWKAVMGSEPTADGGWTSEYGRGDNYPAYRVSYNDIVNEFIPKLNRLTGKTFRLPTEAEWEYAARGGNKSKGYKYSGSNTLGSVAWYKDNSDSKTHPVKKKAANELGLYDMSGNVSEWCSDWFGDYSSGSQTNPVCASSGWGRVLRGGGCDCIARCCRVSFRNSYPPGALNYYYGFRLVIVH